MRKYLDQYQSRNIDIIEAMIDEEASLENTLEVPFSDAYAVASDNIISAMFNAKSDKPPSLTMVSNAVASLSDDQQAMWGDKVRHKLEGEWKYMNEQKILETYDGMNI